MAQISLNLYDIVVKIDFPNSLSDLQSVIALKYMFNKEDLTDVIIFFKNNGEKFFIKNDEDLINFAKLNIPIIYLDVKQNSILYNDLLFGTKYDKEKLEELIIFNKELKNNLFKVEQNYKKEVNQFFNRLIDLKEQGKKMITDYMNKIQNLKSKLKNTENLIFNLQQKFKTDNAINNNDNHILEFKSLEMNDDKNLIFEKLNKVLNETINQVNNLAQNQILSRIENNDGKFVNYNEKNENENKTNEIAQIQNITRDVVNQINSLTKFIINQSNLLIEKISNPDLSNISSENILTEGLKKHKKQKQTVHYKVKCDNCNMNPIIGIRYKCETCKKINFCENCFNKKENFHEKEHNFTKITESQYRNIVLHKNQDYLKRGYIHNGVTCNGCHMFPIFGYRYKCMICDDEYNLCENCEKNYIHPHPLVKFSKMSMEEDFNKNFLKLNTYKDNINNLKA